MVSQDAVAGGVPSPDDDRPATPESLSRRDAMERRRPGTRPERAKGGEDGALYWASMSSVTTDSVSGMPRSLARLSAIARRRRMRPATASLVIGGSAR
jgi:hypothetical protein